MHIVSVQFDEFEKNHHLNQDIDMSIVPESSLLLALEPVSHGQLLACF